MRKWPSATAGSAWRHPSPIATDADASSHCVRGDGFELLGVHVRGSGERFAYGGYVEGIADPEGRIR